MTVQAKTKPAAMGTRRKSEIAAGAANPAKPQSKASLVLQMLQRPDGATLDQLVAATGWLPHTTRAALTGLRKKGHGIEGMKPCDGPRVYRLIGREAET